MTALKWNVKSLAGTDEASAVQSKVFLNLSNIRVMQCAFPLPAWLGNSRALNTNWTDFLHYKWWLKATESSWNRLFSLHQQRVNMIHREIWILISYIWSLAVVTLHRYMLDACWLTFSCRGIPAALMPDKSSLQLCVQF